MFCREEFMPCKMSADISFCVSGGAPVFLDVARDRYFRIPASAEAELANVMRGRSETTPHRLISLGVLSEATGEVDPIEPIRYFDPETSLVEEEGDHPRPSLLAIAEIGYALVRARSAIGRRPLADLLRSVPDQQTDEASAEDAATFTLARNFRYVRRLLPSRGTCLADSLAFLAMARGRGLPAKMVFGVISEPFAAHCWVQLGGVVLNDALDNVRNFTPIKVV